MVQVRPRGAAALRGGERVERENLPSIVEAILFVAGEPVAVEDLAHALDLTVSEMEAALNGLRDGYDLEKRGLRLNRYGGSVQLSIRSEYAPYVERLLQPVRQQSLSQAALETLSIIAYRQPVTKAEIEAVRGVKCDYSVRALIARGLIREAGRRETLGRPVLYETTEEFLRHFALESLSDLPAREDVQADPPPELGV